MKHLFVIDDTGSPGNKSESRTLKSDRITYLSVFIDKDIRTILTHEVQSLLVKYSTTDNVLKEFHFTDIINHRKEYVSFDSKRILTIFREFTQILNKYNLPFFSQTVTPKTLAENGLNNNLNKSLDEIALDFLFCRIKMFIEKNNIQHDIEIVIDEGLRKKGETSEIVLLRNVMKDNIMSFKSSTDYLLLQVADFFCLRLE